MIRNLKYAFQFDKKGIKKALLWEWLHSLLITVPSAILLIIIWELFKENPDIEKIWGVIITMGILFLLQLYVAKKAMLASNISTFTIGSKMRIAIGNKLQKLSLGYYKKRNPGDLASVVLQDVANFENIFGHSVSNIAGAVFGTIILSVFLLVLDWKLGLTLIAGIIIAIPFIQFARHLINRYGQKHIKARNATGAGFLEYVQGIRHIKSFGMTGKRFKTLDNALSDLRRESIKIEAIPSPFILTAGVIFELFFVLMVWLGIILLSEGDLSIPVLIAFLIVGYRLYEPMKILMAEYPVLTYMNVSLTRIIDILEAKEQHFGKNLIPNSFEISFNEVSFGYVEGKKVLNNVSFCAPSKTMTALVGPSGSGKTTITSLIARFWDIETGEIKIGGINLRDMSPTTVYGNISEVFQDVYLFDDTIYHNIKIGKPNAKDEEIEEAARKACIPEFSQKLPDGLHTKVGEGGSKLSGGQKQRISIARALLKDAPIVLLDEATASLDPENEIYIQQAIQEMVKNKTVIVIAHKLATIKRADQILVLDKGRLVESGKHMDLMEKDGLYAKLWNIQQKASGWKLSGNPKTTMT